MWSDFSKKDGITIASVDLDGSKLGTTDTDGTVVDVRIQVDNFPKKDQKDAVVWLYDDGIGQPVLKAQNVVWSNAGKTLTCTLDLRGWVRSAKLRELKVVVGTGNLSNGGWLNVDMT